MPPVKAYQIPDWANPANASVLDNWWTRTARTIGQFMGMTDPESQVMGLAAAPVDVPAADAAGAVKQTLRAYHGSPHDFERFDSSKIGTGEGAQAYGHGLYFAESPQVAKDYQSRLAGWNSPARYSVKGVEAADDLTKYVASSVYEHGRPESVRFFEQTAKEEAANGGQLTPDHEPGWFQRAADLAKTMNKRDITKAQGRMYEVNIHASPDELLDWDKPLSQQPPEVLAKVKAMLSKQRGRPVDIDREWADWARGEHVVSAAGHGDPVKSAAALNDAGIKGIQYLDQGSRTAGQGTRNFVIFDDKIIDIARKYGLSLPAAAEVYRAQQRTKPQPAQTGVE